MSMGENKISNRMNRKFCSLASALLLTTGTASAEINHSLGAGVQYAGAVGYQASIQSGKSNFRLGLGVIGFTAGYDYFITPKIALGVQAFGIVLITGYALNLNYYFSPTLSAGWMLGIDVGKYNQENWFGEDYPTRTAALISAGYRF